MKLKIEKLYAWVAEDDDGQQGIIAFINPGDMSMPLIGADMERIESFRDYVEKIASQTGKKIFLMEFSNRSILEIVGDKVLN